MMNWLRIVLAYTLLLAALGVAAGFVLGIINRIVGLQLQHQWGALDATAVIRAALTFAISLGVFSALAKRQRPHYYTVGPMVVLLTAGLNTVSAYLTAPTAVQRVYAWTVFVFPLLFNAIALAVVGLYFRYQKSSSNTSPERTRER